MGYPNPQKDADKKINLQMRPDAVAWCIPTDAWMRGSGARESKTNPEEVLDMISKTKKEFSQER